MKVEHHTIKADPFGIFAWAFDKEAELDREVLRRDNASCKEEQA